jgi:hypothetical protein
LERLTQDLRFGVRTLWKSHSEAVLDDKCGATPRPIRYIVVVAIIGSGSV